MRLSLDVYHGRLHGDMETREVTVDRKSSIGHLFDVNPGLVQAELTFRDGVVKTYSRIDEDGGAA